MPNEARVKNLLQRDKLYDVDIVEFFDDFFEGGYSANATESAKFSESTDRGSWLVSVTDGGIDEGETIVVADDAHGGVLAITTNDADNDMVQIQLNGEGFALASGRQLVFKTRLKLDSVSNGDIFAGLAIANTDVLAGVTDSIGFRIPDADGNLDTVAEKDSTETTADSGEDLSDDTFVTLTIDIDGTNRADFYVGNKAVANVSTNLPDDEALSPCFQVRNASAATSTLSIDYVRVAGDRS